jgi:hypothetical protein
MRSVRDRMVNMQCLNGQLRINRPVRPAWLYDKPNGLALEKRS